MASKAVKNRKRAASSPAVPIESSDLSSGSEDEILIPPDDLDGEEPVSVDDGDESDEDERYHNSPHPRPRPRLPCRSVYFSHQLFFFYYDFY